MLDVDAVGLDVLDEDVVVGDVGDEAGGVEVGFYAGAVGGVCDCDVGELESGKLEMRTI